MILYCCFHAFIFISIFYQAENGDWTDNESYKSLILKEDFKFFPDQVCSSYKRDSTIKKYLFCVLFAILFICMLFHFKISLDLKCIYILVERTLQ